MESEDQIADSKAEDGRSKESESLKRLAKEELVQEQQKKQQVEEKIVQQEDVVAKQVVKESSKKARGRLKRKTSKAREDKDKKQKKQDDPEKLTLMDYMEVIYDFKDEEMEQENIQTSGTAKFPILKQGSSTPHIPGPVTTDEKIQKKNDVKARSKLLMALLNENKSDLDKISIDDLYNNLKVVEQEVKRNAGPSSSSSSQNMEFVSTSSTSNNDDVSTIFGVSTATVLKNKLEKISKVKDDLDNKIKKFENASQSLDKLIRSQINNKSKRGLGYVSYNGVLPPHTGRFSPLRIDLSHTGLPEFAEPNVQSYGVKPIEVVTQTSSVKIFEPVKENNGALIIEDWESEGEYEVQSLSEIKRKTVEPNVYKVEVDIPKQNNKPSKRPFKYAEMYRTQRPRGNHRNWNNLKSHQLEFNMSRANPQATIFSEEQLVPRANRLAIKKNNQH
nr:hypothetical protein [Tanacetum cinerariifolium]